MLVGAASILKLNFVLGPLGSCIADKSGLEKMVRNISRSKIAGDKRARKLRGKLGLSIRGMGTRLLRFGDSGRADETDTTRGTKVLSA